MVTASSNVSKTNCGASSGFKFPGMAVDEHLHSGNWHSFGLHFGAKPKPGMTNNPKNTTAVIVADDIFGF